MPGRDHGRGPIVGLTRAAESAPPSKWLFASLILCVMALGGSAPPLAQVIVSCMIAAVLWLLFYWHAMAELPWWPRARPWLGAVLLVGAFGLWGYAVGRACDFLRE